MSGFSVSLASASFFTWHFFLQDLSSIWHELLSEWWSQSHCSSYSVSGIQEAGSRSCQAISVPRPELAQCHFHHVALVKQPQALPRLKRKRGKFHLWWEGGSVKVILQKKTGVMGNTVGTILGKQNFPKDDKQWLWSTISVMIAVSNISPRLEGTEREVFPEGVISQLRAERCMGISHIRREEVPDRVTASQQEGECTFQSLKEVQHGGKGGCLCVCMCVFVSP